MTISIIESITQSISHSFSRVPKVSQQIYFNTNIFNVLNNASSEDDLVYTLQSLSESEFAQHSDRKVINFREQVFQQEDVPKFGITSQGFDETILSSNLAGDQTSSNRIRVRTHPSIGLTPIIWCTCWIIATSPNRDQLLGQLETGHVVPNFLSEICKKVRTSDGKSIKVDMGSHTCTNPYFKEKFKNTFFDREYVTSTKGFRSFLDFCQYIFSHEANYIPFTVVSSGNRTSSISLMASGAQATFTALNTLPTADNSVLQRTVQLHPFNCYSQNNVKDVNVIDAHLVQNTLTYDKAGTFPLGSTNLLPEYSSYLSSTRNIGSYIYFRIIGTIINDSGFENIDFQQQEKPQKEFKKQKDTNSKNKIKTKDKKSLDIEFVKIDTVQSALSSIIQALKYLCIQIKNTKIKEKLTTVIQLFEDSDFVHQIA